MTLIIAAADKRLRARLEYFADNFFYKVVESTAFAFDCVYYAKEKKPDAIIAANLTYDYDIETLYQELKISGCLTNCKFIVVSQDPGITFDRCRPDAVVMAPFSDFVLDGILKSKTNRPHISRSRRISSLLHHVGMSSELLGYHCLHRALLKTLDDITLINNLSRDLYPKIAEEQNLTPRYVDRLIRIAIEASWKNCPMEVAAEIFGNSISSESGCPSNAQYIATLSEYLLEEADML